jgi:NAD(P)-dependent dehydrogenase (short-subunit alcohol dehydrogenase family)
MMANNDSKVYLVTGANAGLGLKATKQLAQRDGTRKVYLACRNETKALQAIDDLVRDYDIPADKLAFVPFDATDDKSIIAKKIVGALPPSNSNETFDGLLFNAGGQCKDTEGKPSGPNQILDLVQVNLMGHVHLLEALISNGFLQQQTAGGGTTIVYSGSAGARGIKVLGSSAPTMPDTVDEYQKLLTGSFLSDKQQYDPTDYYVLVKGMAALYWSAYARKHPEYVVLTVCPA